MTEVLELIILQFQKFYLISLHLLFSGGYLWIIGSLLLSIPFASRQERFCSILDKCKKKITLLLNADQGMLFHRSIIGEFYIIFHLQLLKFDVKEIEMSPDISQLYQNDSNQRSVQKGINICSSLRVLYTVKYMVKSKTLDY